MIIKLMKKQDLINEFVDVFSKINRAKTFVDFQFYLKGESIFLSYLEETGGSAAPSELAKELQISPARVAAIIKSLEIKKLVIRKSSPGDKRRNLVEITKKGSEWVEITKNRLSESAVLLLDKLGEEDTAELLRILNKISKI